jgi:transcriptional regulator with XRE-family HTH domain
MAVNDAEDPNSVPFHLKEWREERGWTQEELAHRVRKSKSQISRYEKGLRDPTVGSAQDLAHALGIRIEDLFRSPNLPSADALLAGLLPRDRDRMIAIIKTYVSTSDRQ